MILETTIKWTLQLGDKPLGIEENLLENLCDNSDREETSDFTIPQLLQEVYYVDQLSTREDYHPDEKLSLQDKAFDYVWAFHYLIKELLGKRGEHITNENGLDDSLYEKLKGKKGFIFNKYVDNELPDPFSFRNEAYKIFSLLPKKYKSQLSKYSRWDIVAFPDVFTKYWNNGLLAIVTMHNDIYTDDIFSLKKKYKN